MGKSTISLRRSLVVFQFALSIVMIVSTLIIYLQMKYVNTKDMGFKKGQLLIVDINSGKVRHDAQTIKNEFARLPRVRDVAISSRVPGEWRISCIASSRTTCSNIIFSISNGNSFTMKTKYEKHSCRADGRVHRPVHYQFSGYKSSFGQPG